MSEQLLQVVLAWMVIGLAVATSILLLFITAPYGRHVRKGWGPTLPNRWGWILMECPSSIGFLFLFCFGSQRAAAVPIALLAMWQVHYLHRGLLYPFRLQADGKRMPLVIAALGFLFNCANAWINARWISELGSYSSSWFSDPRFVVGVLLFASGLATNWHADSVLLSLRRRHPQGYAIPQGGMFRVVSCPNYFGEMLEWIGWAIACWSLAGAAFAVATAANLLPRALSNHRWYREKFADYPKARRAVVPFVL